MESFLNQNTISGVMIMIPSEFLIFSTYLTLVQPSICKLKVLDDAMRCETEVSTSLYSASSNGVDSWYREGRTKLGRTASKNLTQYEFSIILNGVAVA